MRYLLEDRGDYFGILNEASDTYVAYVHPQKIDLRRGRYRIVDREGDEITAVVCQSASKFDPRSASNFDPFERRVRAVALAPSELVGVAETVRARVGV